MQDHAWARTPFAKCFKEHLTHRVNLLCDKGQPRAAPVLPLVSAVHRQGKDSGQTRCQAAKMSLVIKPCVCAFVRGEKVNICMSQSILTVPTLRSWAQKNTMERERERDEESEREGERGEGGRREGETETEREGELGTRKLHFARNVL